MTLIFQKTLVRAGEVRSFQVHQGSSAGWESYEQANHRVAQRQRHTDWHRVERDLARFTREIAALRRQGWCDA